MPSVRRLLDLGHATARIEFNIGNTEATRLQIMSPPSLCDGCYEPAEFVTIVLNDAMRKLLIAGLTIAEDPIDQPPAPEQP